MHQIRLIQIVDSLELLTPRFRLFGGMQFIGAMWASAFQEEKIVHEGLRIGQFKMEISITLVGLAACWLFSSQGELF